MDYFTYIIHHSSIKNILLCSDSLAGLQALSCVPSAHRAAFAHFWPNSYGKFGAAVLYR